MKRFNVIVILISLWLFVACGGSAIETITQSEPEAVNAIPTAEATETADSEPAEIEPYNFYGPYREPDVQMILATGRPQFINSYADW